METNFKFTVPASLEKSKDGKWVVKGLASAEVFDQQGEKIIQKGINFSHIDQKRGFLNWDHDNSVESTIGLLTGYSREGDKTYIEGELFRDHDKAKAVYGIMKGLEEHGSKAMGLSIEGSIIQRNADNSKIIEKCVVRNVALTLNPVFSDSTVSLVKSFNSASSIEFDTHDASKKMYTVEQVLGIISKSLGVGGSYATETPGNFSGGAALACESIEKEPAKLMSAEEKKKKKDAENIEPPVLKAKMSSSILKANMALILDKISVLYPQHSKEVLWAALKERLTSRFPTIQ